jgi:hypothetical protein
MRILSSVFIAAVCGVVMACTPTNGTPGPSVMSGSPTEGFKNLFAAVKSKDVEAIKANVSKKTMDLAQTVSAKNNTPLEKVYENGFTATTFAESLPEIRDERVNGDMGSVEVWNAKDKRWEDLPFVREDGSWKLAVGDLFADTFQSPGKGRAVKEAEAANVMSNQSVVPLDANVNGNFSSAPRPASNVSNASTNTQ